MSDFFDAVEKKHKERDDKKESNTPIKKAMVVYSDKLITKAVNDEQTIHDAQGILKLLTKISTKILIRQLLECKLHIEVDNLITAPSKRKAFIEANKELLAEYPCELKDKSIVNKICIEIKNLEGFRKKIEEILNNNGFNTYSENEGSDEDKTKISFLEAKDNKELIEQVYDADKNESQFCIYNVDTGVIKYEDEYRYQGVTFIPNTGEEIQKEVVLLPSKAEDYIDEETLNTDIENFIYKWLDVDEDILKFGVWNIKLSWVFDKFSTLNYLRALGDTGQGKSRFKDTFGSIHYKPIRTSGASTPAPIFRMINKWRGSLLLDEADFKKSDESQDMIKLINLGFEKGGHILRCADNNNDDIRTFDPYSPKIICTRKVFNDKATESRCITQVMGGTARTDIKFTLTPSFWKKALELRNKLLMWRLKNYYIIDPEKDIDFDMTHLEPRMQQIVSSYLTLFSNDKKGLEDFKTFVNKKQEDNIDERQNSFDGEIVKAIHRLFVNKKEFKISSKDIIDEGNLEYNGRASSPRAIASHLKSLGFKKSLPTKVDGSTKRVIPLDKKHLTQLFTRYGLNIEKKSEKKENTDFGGLIPLDD